MEKGIVFDIQHFCVDDGPGIRTAVFLKGCPLRCVWCHNAEGLSAQPQLYYTAGSCTGCGQCEAACAQKAHRIGADGHTIDRSACTACGTCAKVCPNGALRLAGRPMTAEEVLTEVAKNIPFYRNSGGGMTLSGGEPLAQSIFSAALAQAAQHRGISVCVETCGYGDPAALETLAQYTDLFLFDFKHSDPRAHKAYTGVDNALILENLQRLAAWNKPVILRCPVIPGVNDTDAHYTAIARLANTYDTITEIHLMPYHPYGLSKFAAMGRQPGYPEKDAMSRAQALAAADVITALCPKPVTVT
jgi:pyruvate formate lyase activating enzyme